MMGKSQRDKGKRGEQELARVFRDYGFKDAHRTQQFCGRGGESADVTGLPKIHVESKRTERLNLYDAIAQAKNDAKEGNSIHGWRSTENIIAVYIYRKRTA